MMPAAIEGHVNTLYSEGMQHGQLQQSLRVVNPFSWPENETRHLCRIQRPIVKP